MKQGPPRTFSEWRAGRQASGQTNSRLLQQSPRHEGGNVRPSLDGPGRQTSKRDFAAPATAASPLEQYHRLAEASKTEAAADKAASDEDYTDRWLSGEYDEAGENFYKYDPGEWLPTIKIEVTEFMFWPWMLITIYASILTFYVQVIHPDIKEWFSMPIDAHVVLGGTLSFLMVFRTNSSYDRWWEARCAWQTVLTTCRSIGTMIAPALRDDEAIEKCLMQLMACKHRASRIRMHRHNQPRIPYPLSHSPLLLHSSLCARSRRRHEVLATRRGDQTNRAGRPDGLGTCL